MSSKKKYFSYFLRILLFLWCLFILFPFIWTLLTSLKSPSDIAILPPKLISDINFSNYNTLLFGGKGGFYTIEQEGFWKFFLNSFLTASITTFLALLLGTSSAFFIARQKKNNDRFTNWILSFRMMPPIAVIIPYYIMMSFVGLVDSIFSLILINTIFNLPLTIWLISAYIKTIPTSLDDMGLVDGFDYLGIFWKIILPLSKPAILTAGLLVFIFTWNEFLFALILTGYNSKTLPVFATGFITERGIIWGQLTATAVLMAAPVIVMTIFMQKYFVKGISFGLRK